MVPLIDDARDALRDLGDVDAVQRYLSENRRRLVPVAIATLLLVAGAVFAVSAVTQDYEQSLQLDVQDAEDDPGLDRVDRDTDNLSDLQEIYRYGTDPQRSDSDDDGIPDDWEARHRIYDQVSNRYEINPLVNDSGEDPDDDGLPNLEEFECGSDPTSADTDADGLPDPFECRYGLDPRSPNTGDDDEDGDGLSLQEEAKFGTDPTSADTDGDGLPDPREVRDLPTDPTRYSTAGHGISDGYLVEHDLNATDAGLAFQDADDDGLSVRKEFQYSRERFNPARLDSAREDYATWLSPSTNDTDGDGMGDGWEVQHALDPLDPSDAEGDFDGDGLSNAEEFAAGSDPRSQDTDGDGLSDPEEVREGWTVTVDGEEKQVFSDPSKGDSDRDFLPDSAERQGVGTVGGSRTEFCPEGPCPLDPLSPDTDLDGLGDAFEVSYDVEPRLDPTLPDTDGDGVKDKAEFDLWSRVRSSTSEDTLTRVRTQDELASCSGVPADTLSGVRSALGPQGDLDGDGNANLVDADADCDGLTDGEEVDPPRNEVRPGSQDTRLLPSTSPALVDTDGEKLPDSWENEFARYDFELADWNLNASKRDSLELDDGKTDAQRDLDGDGVQYEEGYAQPRSYRHTNLEEFEAGTDPNEADTDGDGLTDGWEVFFDRLALTTGAQVDLDPLDDGDAGQISKSLSYTRYAKEGTPEAEPVESRNESATPVSGTDVVRIEGRLDVTYRDEFEHSTDPTLEDTDGDGIPDVWELLYLEISGGSSFDPTDPAGAGRDADADGLTNLEEFEAGTSPVQTDSDLGGIPDDEEVARAGSDPLNPKDDDPGGDIDEDGYPNVCELRPDSSSCSDVGGPAPPVPTDPLDFDTDGDGLLDGPDRPLSDVSAAQSDAFRADGVVTATFDGETFFLGEADRSPPTDPTLGDTAGDGLPDGWFAFYSARKGFEPASGDNDGDPLAPVTEYEVGLPDTWSLEEDGVWWFGPDPTETDTDGDGDADGLVEPRTGVVRGADYDYDNDGLNDFVGEDPHPFLDADNDGAESPRHAALVRSWVWDEGRTNLTEDGVAPDDVVDAEQMVTPTIQDVTITYPNSSGTVRKGGHVLVEGRLVADGDPVPNAPVLVNLNGTEKARASPGRVLDVAFTDADGGFTLEAAIEPRGEANVTAPNVLFGERFEQGGTRTWTVNTTAHPPNFNYKVVLWNYGVSPVDGEARGYDYETTVDGQTVQAPGVEGTVTDPYIHGDTVTVRAGAQWETPERFDLENDGTLSGSVRLVDSVGDPLGGEDVRLTFRGETIRGTTDGSGTFSFETDTEPFDAPGTRSLNLTFDGTTLVDGAETTVPVRVRFPATISAEVADPSLAAVAGGSLPVEGTLLDSRDEPVGDAPVAVSFAGETVPTNTTPDGEFAVSVPVSKEAPVGNRKVVAQFAGTSTHLSDQTEAGIAQIKQVAQVFLDTDSASLGEDVEVRGELRDLAGRAVRDPTADDPLEVRLGVGDETVTAPVDDENSTFQATIPGEAVPEPGNVTVEATFTGSSLYEGSTTEEALFVTSSTGLLLPERKVTRGSVAAIQGTLVDARGQPVPDASVQVAFQSETLGNATTDAHGRFTLEHPIPGDFPLGTALVEARFDPPENSSLRAPGPTQTFYRVRAATDMTLEDQVVPTGPIRVNGTISDDQDRPVVSAPVTVTFGDRTQKAFTDFSGRFDAVFEGAGMKPRNVTVTATYDGSDRYSVVDRQVEYQVVSDTVLEVTRTTAIVRGDVAIVEGSLRTASGIPVEGATIHVTVNGTTIDRATTDLDGRFRAEAGVPAELPTGPATLVVAYEGDPNHDPSIRRIDTKVKAKPNIQVIVPEDLEVGDEFTGRVRVVDDQGNPISNSEVQVQLSSLRYPFTLETNETGWAEFPGRIQSAGSADVDVRFSGNDRVAATTSDTQIVASEGALARGGPPVAAASLALLLLAAGVVGYLRWRRTVVEEAEQILQDAETQLAAGDEYTAVIMQTYRALADLVQRETELEDRPELTATEFADAIEDTLPVHEENLRNLIEIFEEARYSFHSVGPAKRDQAVANFRAIQRDLAEGSGFVTAPGDAEGGEPA